MINRPLFLLFSLTLILLGLGCSKAPVIVVVDVERVANESKQAKLLISEVEAFAKSAEAQINKAAEQVQAAASDPKSDPGRVNYMKSQFNEMCRQAQEQVELRKNKVEDEVHKKLEETLKVLAKEKGWDLVIRKGTQAALWADDKLDQTELVIKRMDAAPDTKK